MLEVVPVRYTSSVEVTPEYEILPVESDTNARPTTRLFVRIVLTAPGNASRALAFVKYWFVPSGTAVVESVWNDLSPRQYCAVVPETIEDSFP